MKTFLKTHWPIQPGRLFLDAPMLNACLKLAITGVYFVLAPICSQAADTDSLVKKPVAEAENAADPATAAKLLFGRAIAPASMAARSIGFYSRGCLAGAVAMPVDGDTWQIMRLSRNRNWAHPDLVKFLESLAHRVPALTGWPGILVGDLAQPRGGPMLTGHASHQIGLDADVWLTPMPDHTLSRQEREELSATNLVREDQLDIELSRWTSAHLSLIKTAAEDPAVERVLVNPAIKKALCRDASGDRSWLNKVRPFYGHNYHMHVRIGCPTGSGTCREQDATPPGEGCDATLDWWFSEAVLHPKPQPKRPPKPPLTLSQMPPECRTVLLSK